MMVWLFLLLLIAIAELIRISDKATVMRDGKDVGVLEKKDLNEKNLLGLMTGRTESGEKSKSVAGTNKKLTK